MRIGCISDMHGVILPTIEKCDLLLIGGDIVPLSKQRNHHKSWKWFENEFIPWCESLPCEKVVVVGGNHDFFLDGGKEKAKRILENHPKIVYLDCEYYEYDGVTIFGTPLCKIFYDWAFMYTTEDQIERYKKVIDGRKVDILLSHDTPYGTSDVILQETRWAMDGDPHIGNKALKWLAEEMKPTYLIHGHIHSANHEEELLGGTKVYCVSSIDENYEWAYPPLYFDFDI